MGSRCGLGRGQGEPQGREGGPGRCPRSGPGTWLWPCPQLAVAEADCLSLPGPRFCGSACSLQAQHVLAFCQGTVAPVVPQFPQSPSVTSLSEGRRECGGSGCVWCSGRSGNPTGQQLKGQGRGGQPGLGETHCGEGAAHADGVCHSGAPGVQTHGPPPPASSPPVQEEVTAKSPGADLWHRLQPTPCHTFPKAPDRWGRGPSPRSRGF